MSNDNEKLHEHDENCQCGSHDDHNHQHQHKPITITTHDTSVIGSYKFIIEKPFAEAEIILDELLKQVAKEVTALGGIIGHIKALLSCEDKSCMISITEEESSKRYGESSRCNVEGVAIVFLVEPYQLEGILFRAFSEGV
ncbi:MAG: hypothetical protein NUK65_12515 [Firmicutes bacterium]|nr:hypothetical protein [Bacillota bacterium]